MAITPSQWSHVLTIPESYTPPAATSGQTLVITESVIAKLSVLDQTTFWSNVQNGGGDVRICTDSGGVNQLPVEIVSLDNVAETCVIWTRKETYTGAGNLYLFIGKVGETQPAVTDSFGRNAVWVDYHAVLHLNDTNWIDSTGNGYDATGGASVVTEDNPFGIPWAKFDTFNNLNIPTGSSLNNSFLTIQAIAKIDADSGTDAGVVSNRWSTQGNNFFQLTTQANRTTGIVHDGNGENQALGPSLGTEQPKWFSITSSQSDLIAYIDGNQSSIDTTLSGDNQLNTNLNTRVGTYFDGSSNRTINGKVGEVRITLSTLPPSYIATEYANQNDPASFYGTPTIATTGGGGAVEQPVVSEFSGSATVNALASAQAEKRITASSDSLVTTTTTSLASKHVQLSGQSSVTTSSVSLFEKRGLFSGDATVNLTSEVYASKITELSGDATVNVVASGTLIDGNFEIHSFSGGALITASASGQALKVGLVSGQSTTHASASGQASKVAHVDGNATVTTSTQSAISKIASVFGEAISHITASAIAAKRVVLSGASTVITTVYGQFFNTESNVETYQTIVQGRVRANPEVQGRVKANPEIEGTVKSTTIQGRVK